MAAGRPSSALYCTRRNWPAVGLLAGYSKITESTGVLPIWRGLPVTSLATDVTGNPRQIGRSPIDSVIFEYPASSPNAGLFRLVQFNADEGLPATRGYDLATGVGSPNALFLRSFGRF